MSDDSDDKSQHVDSDGLWATASGQSEIDDIDALAKRMRTGLGQFQPMPHPPMGYQCRSIAGPIDVPSWPLEGIPTLFKQQGDPRTWMYAGDGTVFPLACTPIAQRIGDNDSVLLFRLLVAPTDEPEWAGPCWMSSSGFVHARTEAIRQWCDANPGVPA